MPEIKIKHVVSFSSEDKVHKAENILKSETYRKWKCASPGEKNASIVLQFEKATQIHSIDIGNEGSAFVEVLVGRSSDSVNDYQVLLVASSFMSPLESRNERNTNRVRMFGSDKLAQNLKDEKWDCVQVVCTQPFNKNISYGLTFINFHSPPEKNEEQSGQTVAKTAPAKLGAFNIKYEDDEEEDNSPTLFLERKNKTTNSLPSTSQDSPSYAASILASSSKTPLSPQANSLKRKSESLDEPRPPAKKDSTPIRVNKEKVGYKDILGPKQDADLSFNQNRTKNDTSEKKVEKQRMPNQKPSLNVSLTKAQPSSRNGQPEGKRFSKLMERVVFVLSGFVNPLRGEIRDKAMEMGAKYKGDWDRSCTHLVCAFLNTPKFTQVQGMGGRIVRKEWILDCHKKKTLIPWRNYILGTYDSSDSSEDSESEIEEIQRPRKKPANSPKVNGVSKTNGKAKVQSKPMSSSEDESLLQPGTSSIKKSPVKSRTIKSESETEDEDAIEDYIADTDVDSDSGGNTEDEILKIEMRDSAKKFKKETDEDDDESLLPSKPNTRDLPLPEIPGFFKKRHFFLYGDFTDKKQHDLLRYISAYDGVVEDYMSQNVKYVITESKWDDNFNEALSENEDLIFVKPEWIFKCKEAGKLLPYQPFIVIPES